MTGQPLASSTGPSATPPTEIEGDSGSSKKRPAPASSEEDEAGKLAARREANRIHAFKSRQRSKALLQELQRTVELLSGEKMELERENAVLRAQVDVLQQQNLALTQSQRMLLIRAGQQVSFVPSGGPAPTTFCFPTAISPPAAAPTPVAPSPFASAPFSSITQQHDQSETSENSKQQAQAALTPALTDQQPMVPQPNLLAANHKQLSMTLTENPAMLAMNTTVAQAAQIQAAAQLQQAFFPLGKEPASAGNEISIE